MAGEMFGNLAMGTVMMVLAVPLTLIHIALLWVLVRVLRGGNPLGEVFGRGPIVTDNSIIIATVLFVAWCGAYFFWKRSQERIKDWDQKTEKDPAVLDITLVAAQILFASPAVIMSGLEFYGNVGIWARLDAIGCAAVLNKLLSSPHRVSYDVLKRDLPKLNWDVVLEQLKLIPGVVFLRSTPAGLSVTGELRQSFMKHHWEEEWKPPPREEKFEFACLKCGQRLRIRRFQLTHSIRCPNCQARYRGRLDLNGRLRMEPEPEQKSRQRSHNATSDLAAHYRTLGLPTNADLTALRRAYRQLMKKYHPDLYAMEDTSKRTLVEEKAKQINEAYHALLDYLEGK